MTGLLPRYPKSNSTSLTYCLPVSAVTDEPVETRLYPELPDYLPDGRFCHDHAR